jgi:hypothetical protein
MSKHYSVSLPVKPYILKYVQTIEGSPLEFRGSSMLCMIIRAFMENKSYTGLSQNQLQTAVSSRTAKLEILVPIKKMYTIGASLRPDGIVLINQFLEEWFERALIKFMDSAVKKEGRYKGYRDAYYAFASAYGIDLEEDITLDGLKQMEYRLRKKPKDEKNKKDGNFFSNLVPSL